ncbi:hypothetical protein [Pantoea vagans]|uniref:hypothetical protein n=1 Tax=Pantoea vagans TaxID=470934 RepID=UPI0023AF94C0|nr:hypothetical protein [Pantoea vagans]MDE8555282.1 hypothetical protein [Pantoea vagans]MDE8575333.1 hypothetical protein [Pantoea vagans]
MKYIAYLRNSLREPKERWSQSLKEILISDSLNCGTPYDETIKFLLFKYKSRSLLCKKNKSMAIGLDDLINSLLSYSENKKAKVYPLRNDLFSGDCITIDDKVIGCALIKRGLSSSKKGLWMNGDKIA